MMANTLFNQTTARLFALAVLSSALGLPLAQADETPPAAPAGPASPWGFNLSTYLWLAGVNGDFSAGPRGRSIDASFIDIANKSSRVPLGFMGRLEAHYEHFGFYVDGNYMDLQFKPVAQRFGDGLNTELGVMDYGFTYRVFGPTAAQMQDWRDKKSPNRLDVYVGARTFWLENSASASGPLGLTNPGFTSSKSFTSPVIGGRFAVDFTANWFAMADANFGGFGAQNVDFTGSLMGVLGYKTSFFGVPASVEAGYKALRYNVGHGGAVSANATLNGPFIGLTGYW